jgi:hypothetical protein
MSVEKTKMLENFESKNVELFNLLTEKRVMNDAIDYTNIYIENSVEYNEEERITYKKAMLRDGTRVYRRERDLIVEELELLRNEMFILKERITL